MGAAVFQEKSRNRMSSTNGSASVLIVGSMALDDLELPTGNFKDVVGGAATFCSIVCVKRRRAARSTALQATHRYCPLNYASTLVSLAPR